jgi:2-polyprenyl-6-methoxyphenol hydroxylase-like FAD-dependent oxidoreductase
MSKSPFAAPVGIVGGGPVGLTLALFLDYFGVQSIVFDKEPTTRWHPKGSTESARSMEHFRRLGLSEGIRQLGLPEDHPTDVAYFTRLSGYELARLRMPSTRATLAAVQRSGKTDQVPEPVHRANQMYLDRFLFDAASQRRGITLRFGTLVTGFSQDEEGVNFVTESARREQWRVHYMVGCDGGRSDIRRALGFHFNGEPGLEQRYFGGRMFSTHIRSPELWERYLKKQPAWQYWTVNPEVRSSLISVNGTDEFLFRTRAEQPDQLPTDEAVRKAISLCVGSPTETQVLAHEPWTAGMALVIEKLRDRRVFLAGDAAHLFTPTGGFGMNTGLDDAVNIAWKLAAVLQGWGGPRLLDTYEQERLPIAARNTEAARQLTANIADTDVPSDIEADSSSGASARLAAGKKLASFAEQFSSLGVQLGARYDRSDAIVQEGASPADDPINYKPTSQPGGRLPHSWLNEGRAVGSSIYDRLSRGFTLIRLSPQAELRPISEAAARKRIHLQVVDIDDPELRSFYDTDLILVRPDQYVAARGSSLLENPDRVLFRITGH